MRALAPPRHGSLWDNTGMYGLQMETRWLCRFPPLFLRSLLARMGCARAFDNIHGLFL
jgi:hypothetical protein